MSTNYWVVGAMFGGKEDVLETFVTRGYWYCWDLKDFPSEVGTAGNSIRTQQERFEKVKKNDRIAVKRLLGQGAREMAVLAIGIVKDVDIREWRIYVDWVACNIENRRVPLRGCTAAIHGPFVNNGEEADWVRQVFCL